MKKRKKFEYKKVTRTAINGKRHMGSRKAVVLFFNLRVTLFNNIIQVSSLQFYSTSSASFPFANAAKKNKIPMNKFKKESEGFIH